MPHPVPPPEPPAIVNALLPEEIIDSAQKSSSNWVSSSALATPTQPEAFAPELSPLNAAKSAALLGPPFSVGRPILQVERQSLGGGSSSNVGGEQSLTPRSSQAEVLGNQLSINATPGDQAQIFQSSSSHNKTVSQLSITQLPSVNPQPREFLTFPVLREGETPPKSTAPPPQGSEEPWPEEGLAPAPENSQATVQPQPQLRLEPSPAPGATTLTGSGGLLEISSDRQEYEVDRRVVTAEGNVLLRFQGAVVDADRLQVNLPNQIVVAEGNVAYKRGQQLVRGERFEYYLAQDTGFILNASGELYVPSAGSELSLDSSSTATDINTEALTTARPLSDRILANQPLQQINNPGGFGFVFGAGRNIQNQNAFQQGGNINRLRYQAERVDFNGDETLLTNIRLTNDPFSPPELELRADTAKFRRISPLVDEITTTRSRVVFDQGLSIPIFQNRRVIDRRDREPGLFTLGYDKDDRGGVFIQRTFEPFSSPLFRLSLTPQFLIQKAFDQGKFFDPSVFGLKAGLDATLSPRTTLQGKAVFTSLGDDTDPLDPNNQIKEEERVRGSLRLRQLIGDLRWPHTLTLESSFRDRLFNGTLGFQTVQRSFGAVLTSPSINIGQTGINLRYQAGVQAINADTDRIDLLDPVRSNNRVDLTRYQASATLSRGFVLWQGKALPATAEEGLRYTPVPVVPYLSLGTSVTGVVSAYSSSETQDSLNGSIGLYGQFGHFSRPFLDYTGFNISYSQTARTGTSPFLFDRVVDTSVVSAGITQQIYGPFRVGFQTSISLDNGQEISTDYFLEYSRRTYNVILRYNPVLELGSISLRISDFNWLGNPEPFAGAGVRPVVQGVTQ